MCFFSQSKLPPMPEPPAAPPNPVSGSGESEISAARERNRARAALAQGRAGTIFTSSLGLTSPASTAPKTVLGA